MVERQNVSPEADSGRDIVPNVDRLEKVLC